jgi:hypothetical protein
VVPTVLVIDRGYAFADLAFDSGTVRFVTTHLEALWDPGRGAALGPAGPPAAGRPRGDTDTPVVLLGRHERRSA